MIWSDAILSFRKHHPNVENWKSKVFIYITWIHTMNLWIILLWFKYFNILNVPLLIIDIFPGNLLDEIVAFTMEFALPLGIINYFLIYHKNKYKKVIERYKDFKTRYAPIYSLTIAILTFMSAVLYGMLT